MSRDTDDRATHVDHVLEELRLHTEELTKWATLATDRAQQSVVEARKVVADARTTRAKRTARKRRSSS